MYAKRIQLVNYGPIEKLDIEFPFEGETPKPVVLVGENGSGKSILLSHIVNGLIEAKGIAYPETPEVESGKVYKLRSNFYIKPGSEFYFGRVDFEGDFFVSEIRSRQNKQEYSEVPTEAFGSIAEGMWNKMDPKENDHYDSNLSSNAEPKRKVDGIFAENCVLYFPPNRFEEPAWLNEKNLQAQAQYMDLEHIQGQTERKVINHSPLLDNQNWLLDLLFDRAVFELNTQGVNLPVANSGASLPFPVFYSGHATRTYETALQMVRIVTRSEDARFGIGRRNNRVVALESELTGQIVPNIFQLSSGETSLLNLFLSILRDFDLCGAPFSQAADIRGIVVVDEIDLHLHAVHQHEVLPELIQVFPNVQFVVTTHSPLFVLGMQRILGKDGFSLYRLPQGQQIAAEEFSEFGSAYQAFTETAKFSNEMHAAIEASQKPTVFVEGSTDQKYIYRASQLLGKEAMLNGTDVKSGSGVSNLKKVWDTSKHIDFLTQKVVLLFDCDAQSVNDANKGTLFRRVVPMQDEHPVRRGVENLFTKETLEKAKQHKTAFIDIDSPFTRMVRGEVQSIPETWIINEDEKANLCDWLCANGTREDFEHFQVIFDLIEEVLNSTDPMPIVSESETTP